MRKTIVIIGIVFIFLSVVSLVLFNFTDFQAPIEYNSQVHSDYTGNWVTVIDQSNTGKISGLYSSISFYISLTPQSGSQTFSINIGIAFPNNIYQGKYCTLSSPCILETKQVTTSQHIQVNFQTFERKFQIPLITSAAINLPNSNTDRAYLIQVSTNPSIQFSYQAIAKSRMGIIYGGILVVIGLVATIIGFVAKDASGVRPMKSRSWQEPTLGSGNSRSSTKNSYKPSKSSSTSKVSSQPARSTAIHCKKCGGVMPRNSQYCPHCYTRQ